LDARLAPTVSVVGYTADAFTAENQHKYIAAGLDDTIRLRDQLDQPTAERLRSAASDSLKTPGQAGERRCPRIELGAGHVRRPPDAAFDLDQGSPALADYECHSEARSKRMNHKRLCQRVQHALECEPAVDVKAIGVTVNGDVVTLTGHVSSEAEKLAVERAVKRVRGVHAIAEEIDVHAPSARSIADDEIARHALYVLEWDTQIPKDAIQITVQNGGVTLIGGVESPYQRQAVEDHVRKIPGVAWVVNQIAIKLPAECRSSRRQ
jgi:osmotically-inducible protein OsmY